MFVYCIKDERSGNSVYYKNIETKLWNMSDENYGQYKDNYYKNNAKFVSSLKGQTMLGAFVFFDDRLIFNGHWINVSRKN